MGIKSFQGKRDTSQVKEDAQILVSDYMTKKLITFKAEDSLDYVIQQLITNKISGGPVVNDKNDLIVII
jgi:predicted transcriptional regulator